MKNGEGKEHNASVIQADRVEHYTSYLALHRGYQQVNSQAKV